MSTYVTMLGCVLFSVSLMYHFHSTEGSLRMISIILNQADITPNKIYQNDPHKSHEWPGGFGALTAKGCLQALNQGEYINEMYNQLLPSNKFYTRDAIHSQSSYREACIMNAQCFLAGLLPPPPDGKNPLPIAWQPAPVIDLVPHRDYFISGTKPCPKYDEAKQEVFSKPLDDSDTEILQKISRGSGENITNLESLGDLYDTLYIENLQQLSLPDWANDEVFLYFESGINVFESKKIKGMKMQTETHFMKKVRGGPLVSNILNNMLKKQSSTLRPDRKLFLYSGTDITMVNVLNALDVFSQIDILPGYASSLVFELHDNGSPDYEVQLSYHFYRDDFKDPIQISIPNCGPPCTLSQFEKSVQEIVVVKTESDYEKICYD